MPCQTNTKDTPLTPEQSRLAKRRAKACRAVGDDAEMLRSASFLGLVRAARSFRPELGYRFTTWANACREQEIRFERQRQIRHRRRWRQEWVEPISGDGQLSLLVDPQSGRDEELEEIRDQFADRLDQLKRKRPRAAEAVIRGANGETMVEIAVGWGVTRQRAQQLRDAGLAFLRRNSPKSFDL